MVGERFLCGNRLSVNLFKALDKIRSTIVPLVLTLNRLDREMLPNPDSAKADKHAWTVVEREEREGRALALQLALGRAEKVGWAEKVALARIGVQEQAIGERTWAGARALARKEREARKEVRARARARALAEVLARARAEGWARALAEVWARARAGVWARARAEVRFMPAYREVLADSTLKDIIYSINPDHRHWLARILWPSSQNYWWFIEILVPITRLPPELLQQIFLIFIDEARGPPLVLMLVCKHWYTLVTSIWASLKLGTSTPRAAVTSKLQRKQWLLDILVDTEIDRGQFTPSGGDYEAIFAAIEAVSRWRSFVVETFPTQADLPEDLVNHGLQRCSDTVMSRLRTFKIKSACEMSPLLNHLLRILGTSASGELTTVEINSPNVVSFLVPTYASIFRSIKVLSLDTPRLRNPVDILPHLHQLEALTASHLPLPVYHNDVDFPFVHTLRHLALRSVSIQWMSGRTFHILKNCTILFPLHRHVLHTFHTTLPNCRRLTFEGYPLNILDGVSTHKLTRLSVKCVCSNKQRGNQELARFSSQALQESRLAPRILHIGIEAMSRGWTKAFAFMSNLEELVIGNAQPSSLGVKVLELLVVHPVHSNNLGTFSTLAEWNTPVCPSLKRFGLWYRRWLRPGEHFDLNPVFKSIIRSRELSQFSLQSFRIWEGGDQNYPLELIGASWTGKTGRLERRDDIRYDANADSSYDFYLL